MLLCMGQDGIFALLLSLIFYGKEAQNQQLSHTNIMTNKCDVTYCQILRCDRQSKAENTFDNLGRNPQLLEKETRKLVVIEATRSLYQSLELHTYPVGNSINVTRLLLHLIFYFTTAMVLEICRRCNSIQRTDTVSYQAKLYIQNQPSFLV